LATLVVNPWWRNCLRIGGGALGRAISLTSIDLSEHFGIGGWSGKQLGELVGSAIAFCSSITSVTLHTCLLGLDGSNELAKGLSRSTTLEQIKLIGTRSLHDESKTARHASSIVLPYSSKVGSECWNVIAAAARSNSLKVVDVGNNSSDQATALVLLAAMKGTDMVSIGMAACKLGVEGTNIIAGMVATSTSLRSVDLRQNSIGTEGCKVLGEALRISVSLTVADLRYNNLDNESATMLANTAKEKKISLCGITPDQTDANMQGEPGKRMDTADAILLTADLAVGASLMNIDLSFNNITGVTMDRAVHVTKSEVQTAALPDLTGVESLAFALSTNKYLQRLDARWNGLEDVAKAHLRDVAELKGRRLLHARFELLL